MRVNLAAGVRDEWVDDEQLRAALYSVPFDAAQMLGKVDVPRVVPDAEEVDALEVGLRGHQPGRERVLEHVLEADDEDVSGMACQVAREVSASELRRELAGERRLASPGQAD